MNKAICSVSVAPLRETPFEQSEMVTQLLYGETCTVLEKQKGWLKIRVDFDGYEGWITDQQLKFLSKEQWENRAYFIVHENFISETVDNGKLLLSIGSEVDFPIRSSHPNGSLQESIVRIAKEFLNTPYLWGGKSFFAVDCSGFVQLVFKVHGIKLPRNSDQQAEVGEALTFVEESVPGDLAFFEDEEGKVVHVGIMLGNQQIIHCSGKVRIDELDSSGIFNTERNQHTHKLRFVRRVLSK